MGKGTGEDNTCASWDDQSPSCSKAETSEKAGQGGLDKWSCYASDRVLGVREAGHGSQDQSVFLNLRSNAGPRQL